MKILLLGATGLVGSNFLDLGFKNQIEVVPVLRRPPTKTSYPFIHFDSLGEVSLDSFTHAINCIGNARASSEQELEDSNYLVPKNLMSQILNRSDAKLIHISTTAQRNTPYGVAKRNLDNWATQQSRITLLRPSYVIGGQDTYLSSSAVFVRLRMKRLKYFSEGIKAFISAKQLAEGILSVCRNDPQILPKYFMTFERFLAQSSQKLNLEWNGIKVPYEEMSDPFDLEFFEGSKDSGPMMTDDQFNQLLDPCFDYLRSRRLV